MPKHRAPGQEDKVDRYLERLQHQRGGVRAVVIPGPRADEGFNAVGFADGRMRVMDPQVAKI